MINTYSKFNDQFIGSTHEENTMALPLVPFVVGAAVGSVATYLYKDEQGKEKLKNAVQKLFDNVKSFVTREQASNEDTVHEDNIHDEKMNAEDLDDSDSDDKDSSK